MKTLFQSFALGALFTVLSVASTVNISFTNTPTATANGHYVGYSLATLDFGGDAIANFELICDDILHTTNIPSGPFTFFVSTVPELQNNRFFDGTPEELAKYQIAALILWNYDQAGGRFLSAFDQGSYQYALWKLFTPSTSNFGNSAQIFLDAQTQQQNGGNLVAYESFRVFTPEFATS